MINSQNQLENDQKEFNLIAGIAPLSLIDVFDGISIRPTVDIKLYKNYALGLEYGHYLDIDGEFKRGQTGYLIKLTFKYYLNKERVFGNYIALEYQYKNVTFGLDDQISFPDQESFVKNYSLNRKSNVYTIKFGETTSISKHLVIDFYVGLGVRFLNSTASGISPEELDNISTTEDNEDTLIEGLYIEPGNFIRPNLTLGFKLGYKIF
ncbi:hypothetical protein BST94_03445 [Nonlabens xylanidelens]|nr:hypothetical protein BST94_03445 [Nonlabens xylanidelens]